MSLTMGLGTEVQGADLCSAVETSMKQLPGFDFQAFNGSYFGEGRLVPGYNYLSGLAQPYSTHVCDVEHYLLEHGLKQENKQLIYHGRVDMHRRDRTSNRILEVSRRNQDYVDAIDDRHSGGSPVFGPLFTGIRAIILAGGRAFRFKPDNYSHITYDDNIFVELDADSPYEEVVFYIDALDPEFRGGTVRKMKDIHFRRLRPSFERMCNSLCRELEIPRGPALGSLYSERGR